MKRPSQVYRFTILFFFASPVERLRMLQFGSHWASMGTRPTGQVARFPTTGGTRVRTPALKRKFILYYFFETPAPANTNFA